MWKYTNIHIACQTCNREHLWKLRSISLRVIKHNSWPWNPKGKNFIQYQPGQPLPFFWHVCWFLASPCDVFDRTCRHFRCPPEVKSQWWKMEEPEHSSTFPLRPPTEDDESASKPARDRGGSCKRVTMASVSRYLTDRRYLVRRPLVSAQHTSILKKMETEEVRMTATSLKVL